MKATNITPEVIKMEKKLYRKGLKVAGYMLDQALNKEQIQIFKDEDNVFWFENRNAAKYAVRFLTSHITRYMKLTYRDAGREKYGIKPKTVKKTVVKKQEVKPVAKETKEETTAVRRGNSDLVSIADKDDLKEYVNKYMKGVDIPKDIDGISKAVTESFTKVVNKIYGGKKDNYREMNKMSDEKRKEYKEHNKQEFQWFFDTLVWIAKPSDAYIAAHKKASTANYLKVTGDLRSVLTSSLFVVRPTAKR